MTGRDGLPDPFDFLSFMAVWTEQQGQEVADIHVEMAEWLDRSWVAGERDLLLLAFRGSGKSTIAGLFCAWRLACDPDTRIMVLAAEERLATKMVRTVKRILTSHPLCLDMRPPRADQWAAASFLVARRRVGRDPSMVARGITGNITGSHADLIVCDDVEVPNTCDTDAKRQALRDRLGETAHVLMPGGTTFYIGTPHSYYSIYATQPRPEVGESEPFLAGFSRLEIPVWDAAEHSCWPEKFPADAIRRIRRRNGPNRFASQMLLRPMSNEQGRLAADRLVAYGDGLAWHEAAGRAVLSIGGVRMVSARAWWDPALATVREGRRGDGSVIAALFIDGEGTAWLHRVQYLSSPPGQDAAAQAQCRQVAAFLRDLHLPVLHVETNGVGGFLPAILRQVLAEEKLRIAVRPELSTRPKHLRIVEAFDARLAAGALKAHDSVFDTPFLHELREWRPGGNSPDDGLDAVAGALLAEPARLPRRPAPGPAEPDWRGGPLHRAASDFTP